MFFFFKIQLFFRACIDYEKIPKTNYINYKGICLYALNNKSDNYKALIKNCISSNEKLPEEKMQYAFFIKGVILCYNKGDECPINDIVFNNNPAYIDNNITYKTIKINDYE